MAIKRYIADADNTIVNSYQTNNSTRGTGSNSGQSDVLEVYSVYGRQTSTSSISSKLKKPGRSVM